MQIFNMSDDVSRCLRILAVLMLLMKYTEGHYVDVWIKTPNIGSIYNGMPVVLDYVQLIQHYEYNNLQLTSFNFSVKAASRVSFYFFPTKVIFPENGYYILVIGAADNSKLQLFYRQNKYASLEPRKLILISGLLNEFEYRPFWMDLSNNAIRLGKGMVQDTDTLLEWQDSSFNIMSVAILVPLNQEGFWILTVKAHFTGYYSACHERNTRGEMVLIQSINQVSKWHCIGECSKMINCLGINYNAADISCELIRNEQYIVVQREAYGWTFYRKCLQYTKGCLCD